MDKVITLLAAILLLGASPVRAETPESPLPWFEIDGTSGLTVHLHVFHSASCPHCRRALADLESLERELPFARLHTYELSGSPRHVTLYREVARSLGSDAAYVPAFAFCATLWHGYDAPETTGRALRQALTTCHAELVAAQTASPDHDLSTAPPAPPLDLPLLGLIDAERLSLPVLAVVLGGLDAFNPCAFFVLLFLLSLMVHARSRARMLMVGGVFVAISGVAYFLFMSAWLNVFLLAGELRAITVVAGLVALLIAALNLKDFAWWRRGPSLTIPEAVKPALYARTRRLVGAGGLAAMLAGTASLAVVANTYELLCTAGFPMVFTRAITLQDVSPAHAYILLALYNLVYVLPLLAIVVGFAWTLGTRRLSERGGRRLKLLSGLMMLGLSLVLLLVPHWLHDPMTAVVLAGTALLLTVLLDALAKRADGGPASRAAQRP